VLLTGGTGFLGTQIARRVISNTDLSLVVLVRAQTVEEAELKVEREWWPWPELRNELNGRVTPVIGDVSKPRLGLSDRDYVYLVGRITHIIHTAADLRLNGPIDEMRSTNVAGTTNVLEMASAAHSDHGLKRLSHISTAYVAGGRHGQVQEEDLSEQYGFHNTYELTKFEAERLVQEASHHLPVSILRPGMIVGDSNTGEIRTFNTIYQPLHLYLMGGMRLVPASHSLRVNAVPVDYVADSIVRLTLTDEAKGLTFHLTSPADSLPTIGELLGLARQWAKENLGINLPRALFFLPLPAPRPLPAGELTGEKLSVGGLMGKLSDLRPYFSNSAVYRRDNTDRLLGRYEFDWRESFPHLLKYAVYHGLLHPYPRTVHEQILNRLEGRSMPVSMADVVDGRVVERDVCQVRRDMLSASRALRSMGVSKGDRVAVVGLNSSRYAILDVAIGLVGAVSVPIYYTSPPNDIRDFLTDCKARLLFVGSPLILKELENLGLGVPVVSFCREEQNLQETHWYESWMDFLARGTAGDARTEEATPTVSPVGLGDAATIRFTSGTTGRPKGVYFTHGNLSWLGEAVCSLFPWRMRSREIAYLSFLPMNHVVEGIICAYAPYYAPARLKMYFLEDFKQLSEALPMVRPTVFFSVPRFYEKVWDGLLRSRVGRTYVDSKGPVKALLRPIVRHVLLSKVGLDRCQQLMVGSAPISLGLLEKFQELGIEIHVAYGLTEAPLVTMNSLERNKLGTVGEPLPETTIRIGEDGEILVKGPQVSEGYISGMPLLDEDGFLPTGDLGKMERGYLVVDGRKKELIKTAYGKYVQPAKIETMLRGMKDVEEAMVVGEGRPFCSALVWVKKGVDPAKASAFMDDSILEMNKNLSHPEQLRRWAILEDDLTIGGGDLTPSMKLRRAMISARLKGVIEGLYAGHLDASSSTSESVIEVTLNG